MSFAREQHESGPASGATAHPSTSGGTALGGAASGRSPLRRAAPGLAGRVSLRTLTFIRWVAIAGQLAALLVVHYGLGFALPLLPALAVVGASVLLNLLVSLRRPLRGRLRDTEAALYLAFDVVQLAALLYLTGGLNNPFSLMILAPITVSATVLTRRSTLALCILAVVCASVLAVRHYPLPWGAPGAGPGSAAGLELPFFYTVGIWAAVVLGSVFAAAYAGSVAAEGRRMFDALSATQLALAREQRLSAVGALAAAAAHELGSPLATIAVTTKELVREVPPDSPFADDIQILQAESDRCREILAGLTRHPETDDESPFSVAPISALVEAVAARYHVDGVAVALSTEVEDDSAEPRAMRSPELVHGLGNIIQNAVQFARSAVTVESVWSTNSVRVTVHDDGPGIPPAMLDRIGEPYISTRGQTGEHMGLGIFIAQVLLEQTGAALAFGNNRGAEVVVTWPRARLEVDSAQRREAT